MLKSPLKRIIIILATLQLLLFPQIGFAEATIEPVPTDSTSTTQTTDPAPSTETAPATTSETPPAETSTQTAATTGPTSPTGADSSTYTYNSTTGLWENDYYTWDPVTKLTAPKPGTVDYSYNPATGKWDTTEWRYDAPSGKYIPNIIENAVLPADAPVSASSILPNTLTATTGPSSPAGSSTTNTANGTYNLFYNASISNKITGVAQTGDASVTQNTLGGNAGTGNATDMATILNMLQSVWDPSSGQIATFNADINGDVTGDITINPSAAPSSNTTSSNLTVNSSKDTAINNDIDLTANTGNALVSNNTQAGDATTGTANAVANVVNLLNSYITSGQSFVGSVNINGNLNGDILLPPEMIDQLLASNVPRASIDLSKVTNSNLIANFNEQTSINNNVDASAATGNATVANNSNAGSATSGNASTQVTFLNLTGRDIIGSNALLVFVNVHGKWVGMIMNAPGATSALVGGGIVSDTTDVNTTINSDSKTDINNNIKLAAQSGDAEVSSNTKAGSAKTGNATASANIANVSNSNFALTGWFGVLFINVFGNWLGSFGVNTSAGNVPSSSNQAPQPDIQVFGFVPGNNGASSVRYIPTSGNLGTNPPDNTGSPSIQTAAQVLGDSTVKPVYAALPTSGLTPIAQAYIIMAFAGLALTLGGKLYGFFKTRRA